MKHTAHFAIRLKITTIYYNMVAHSALADYTRSISRLLIGFRVITYGSRNDNGWINVHRWNVLKLFYVHSHCEHEYVVETMHTVREYQNFNDILLEDVNTGICKQYRVCV